LLPALVAAQEGDWPSRTIQIVVPYTPGTGADILARILGPKLAERWKVSVVTDNRAGASGNIGTRFRRQVRARRLYAPLHRHVLRNEPGDQPQPAVRSRQELRARGTARAKLGGGDRHAGSACEVDAPVPRSGAQRAGKLNYSSPGKRLTAASAMELLKLDAHVDLVHVPYKGSGGALADLVGGHVQAMIVSLQTVAPYVQSGKLRMLAVMSAERSEVFPEVPTLKEVGLPDLEVDTWYGVFRPSRDGQGGDRQGQRRVERAPEAGDVRELLAKQGMIPVGGSPERFGALVRSELKRWPRVVAAAGIKAD